MEKPQVLLVGYFCNEWYAEDQLDRLYHEFQPDHYIVEAPEQCLNSVTRYMAQIDALVFNGQTNIRDTTKVIDTLYAIVSTPQAAHTLRRARESNKKITILGNPHPNARTIELCQSGLTALQEKNSDEWVSNMRSTFHSRRSRQEKRKYWDQIQQDELSLCTELNLLWNRHNTYRSLDHEIATHALDSVGEGNRVAILCEVNRIIQSRYSTTLCGRLKETPFQRTPLLW